MKFVNFKIPADKDAVLLTVADYRKTNGQLQFPQGAPIPTVSLKKLNHDICRIRCNYIGTATKDDGFVEGTFFIGKMKNTEKGSTLKGIILTEPVFHVLFCALFVFLTVKMILASAVPVIPVCLVVFVVFMFRKEYQKQNVLYRYLVRAVKETIGK